MVNTASTSSNDLTDGKPRKSLNKSSPEQHSQGDLLHDGKGQKLSSRNLPHVAKNAMDPHVEKSKSPRPTTLEKRLDSAKSSSREQKNKKSSFSWPWNSKNNRGNKQPNPRRSRPKLHSAEKPSDRSHPQSKDRPASETASTKSSTTRSEQQRSQLIESNLPFAKERISSESKHGQAPQKKPMIKRARRKKSLKNQNKSQTWIVSPNKEKDATKEKIQMGKILSSITLLGITSKESTNQKPKSAPSRDLTQQEKRGDQKEGPPLLPPQSKTQRPRTAMQTNKPRDTKTRDQKSVTTSVLLEMPSRSQSQIIKRPSSEQRRVSSGKSVRKVPRKRPGTSRRPLNQEKKPDRKESQPGVHLNLLIENLEDTDVQNRQEEKQEPKSQDQQRTQKTKPAATPRSPLKNRSLIAQQKSSLLRLPQVKEKASERQSSIKPKKSHPKVRPQMKQRPSFRKLQTDSQRKQPHRQLQRPSTHQKPKRKRLPPEKPPRIFKRESTKPHKKQTAHSFKRKYRPLHLEPKQSSLLMKAEKIVMKEAPKETQPQVKLSALLLRIASDTQSTQREKVEPQVRREEPPKETQPQIKQSAHVLQKASVTQSTQKEKVESQNLKPHEKKHVKVEQKQSPSEKKKQVVPAVKPYSEKKMQPEMKKQVVPAVKPSPEKRVLPEMKKPVVPAVKPSLEKRVLPDMKKQVVPAVKPSPEKRVLPEMKKQVVPAEKPSPEKRVLPEVEKQVVPAVKPSPEKKVLPDMKKQEQPLFFLEKKQEKLPEEKDKATPDKKEQEKPPQDTDKDKAALKKSEQAKPLQGNYNAALKKKEQEKPPQEKDKAASYNKEQEKPPQEKDKRRLFIPEVSVVPKKKEQEKPPEKKEQEEAKEPEKPSQDEAKVVPNEKEKVAPQKIIHGKRNAPEEKEQETVPQKKPAKWPQEEPPRKQVEKQQTKAPPPPRKEDPLQEKETRPQDTQPASSSRIHSAPVSKAMTRYTPKYKYNPIPKTPLTCPQVIPTQALGDNPLIKYTMSRNQTKAHCLTSLNERTRHIREQRKIAEVGGTSPAWTKRPIASAPGPRKKAGGAAPTQMTSSTKIDGNDRGFGENHPLQKHAVDSSHRRLPLPRTQQQQHRHLLTKN